MNSEQLLQFTFNMHHTTLIGFINAVERADTPQQRNERMKMLRECVDEFQEDTVPMLISALKL